jgi:hypothetical protein
MSEEKTGLVKSTETRLPKFVENAYESIEKMQEFAKLLLSSKLVPFHFYEKLPDGKPDFSKGKTEAVVAVLIQGYQLQLPPLTALQHIIPVNGLLSIKGDLAKSMIFMSGKLKSASWLETEEGSIENENLMVRITASRADNGQTITRSFSVEQAKRAGLWITQQQVSGSDGWKYKASAWWKYPARMVNYRALGFLARDLFPDVINGLYTTEEAIDMPADQTLVIDQGNGVTLSIPDKDFAEERSKKVTARAIDKIEAKNFAPVTPQQEKNFSSNTPSVAHDPKYGPAIEKIANAMNPGSLAASANDDLARAESPFKPERGSVEMFDGKITKIDGKELSPEAQEERKDAGEWTIETMSKMDTELLVEKINTKSEMIEAMVAIPGKNTNKKLREIIDAWQRGKLDMLTAPFKGRDIVDITAEPGIQDRQKEAENESAPAMNQGIQPNRDFDKQTSDPELKLETPGSNELNKYGLKIPEFDKGNEREFSTTKRLYNDLLTVSPKIDNERWLELRPKVPALEKYKNKEEFLKYATVKEICDMLNAN